MSNQARQVSEQGRESALAGFETAIGFVDDIGASTAANHTVIAVTALKGLE